MFRQYKLRDFRLRLVVLVYAISILSVFVIGSAAEEYQSQQLLGIMLGSVIMLIFALLDYRVLLNFSWVIYAVNLILLVAVIPFGVKVNGARRWLKIGFFRFQPSELTKLALIVFFAYFFVKYKEKLNSFKVIFISLVLLGIPLLLLKQQPHLSAMITICFIFCVLIFSAGLSYKIIGGMIAVAVPTALIGINLILREGQNILDAYQLKRIMAWLEPSKYADDAYQQLNSVIAIGSGQLYGKGLYNTDISSVKNGNFIVEPQTDFIFAIIGEELGFVGCCIIIALLLLVVIQCILIGMRSRDLAGKIICSGVGGLIGFQSFINISVATNMLPNTGVPLPFISYGLTSLVSLYIGIGFVLNVGLQQKKYQ